MTRRVAGASLWLPAATGLLGVAVTLMLWRSLLEHERRQLAVLADGKARHAADLLKSAVEKCVEAIVVTAGRSGVKLRDREGWRIDFAGLKASLWLDPDGKVRKIVPPTGNEALADGPLWAKAAFLGAPPVYGRPVVSRSLLQPAGDFRFDVAVPVPEGDRLAGYLVGVFSTRELYAAVLSMGASPGWILAVFEGANELYRGGSPGKADWIAEARVGAPHADGRLRFAAGPEVLAVVRSPLPRVVLAGGLSIALLLAASVGLAQSAQRRAREAEAAQSALRDSEQQLRAIVDGTMAHVYVKDREGRYLLLNRRIEEFFGRDKSEILGKTDLDLLPLETAERVRANDTRVLDSGAPMQVEETVPSKDGPQTYLSVKVPLFDASGAPYAICAISTDISEAKRYEEVRRKIGALEEQSRLSSEASRLKSEFLANMSHELRTPLNAVIGFAELMHDGKTGSLTSQQREFLGDILTSARHLLQLINDVLDLSKVEAGKMEFRPEQVDPARTAAEIRDILRSLAAQKRISMSLDADPGIGEVFLDPAKLKQVLYNYLSNALKFTGEGGRVVVRVLAESQDRFRLEVEDTGIGIEARDMGRLFQQFQQLDAGAGKGHAGTGLGLALTKRIVEAQGGVVGAKSVPGEGSVFFAVLPRKAAA